MLNYHKKHDLNCDNKMVCQNFQSTDTYVSSRKITPKLVQLKNIKKLSLLERKIENIITVWKHWHVKRYEKRKLFESQINLFQIIALLAFKPFQIFCWFSNLNCLKQIIQLITELNEVILVDVAMNCLSEFHKLEVYTKKILFNFLMFCVIMEVF